MTTYFVTLFILVIEFFIFMFFKKNFLVADRSLFDYDPDYKALTFARWIYIVYFICSAIPWFNVLWCILVTICVPFAIVLTYKIVPIKNNKFWTMCYKYCDMILNWLSVRV